MRAGAYGSGGGGKNWGSTALGQTQSAMSLNYFSTAIEIRPFEPREFPLGEEMYDHMLKEDQNQV